MTTDQAAASAEERRRPVLMSREQFRRAWRYRGGEHVTLLGPTGCGKTTLAYELLGISTTPKLTATVMCMKPKDSTVKSWTKRLGYRTVRNWPPMPSIWQPRKSQGFTLWPKHTFDPDRDDYNLYREFRKAILDGYKRGNRILFADETYGLTHELKLHREMITVWSRGRAMDTGLWAATQKPSHIPLWAYSQAQHLFIWYDPDKRARDRYAEIGGIDPDAVAAAVMSLKPHQALYIRRAPSAWCIVDAT